jgi:hypothetical protein
MGRCFVSTVTYYFTATGNSLAVARDIAVQTKGDLVPIASLADRGSIDPGAEVIGIVFPVYYASLGASGIPLIVERFARRLENIGSSYLFAVYTHGGVPGATLGNLARIVASRGGALAAGFSVHMSSSYPVAEKLRHALLGKELRPDPLADDRKRRELYASWQQKLPLVHEHIAQRKSGAAQMPLTIQMDRLQRVVGSAAPAPYAVGGRPYGRTNPYKTIVPRCRFVERASARHRTLVGTGMPCLP